MEIKPLQIFGKYSYAMYVFQSPLIPLIKPMLAFAGLTDLIRVVPAFGVGYVMIMFMITFVAAIVSWHLFEAVVLRLRDSAFANRND